MRVPVQPPHGLGVSVRALASAAFAVLAGAVAPSVAACGLSLSGTGLAGSAGPSSDAAAEAATGSDLDAAGASAADAAVDTGNPAPAPDAADDGASPPAEASDGAVPCLPSDAGVSGALDLSKFAMAGSASYGENGDARITLTNSENSQVGAAWNPAPVPGLVGYDLTFSIRVGPGDVAGDGITFAVLSSGGGRRR
jgi:hypothetical protein